MLPSAVTRVLDSVTESSDSFAVLSFKNSYVNSPLDFLLVMFPLSLANLKSQGTAVC